MYDDTENLRRYADSRDEAAFSAFVRENIDLVYSAAHRQTGGDRPLAEDITQQVFTAAAQKAAMLSRHAVIRAWLYQTTRYATIDAVRAKRSRKLREEAVGRMTEIDASSPDPDAGVHWEQLGPELDEFVSTLRARDREAVILRFFGGKNFAEIGTALHVSENAARMRIDRALEKLRTHLARRGITSTCAALAALVAENSSIAAPATLTSASIATALSAPPIGGFAATLSVLKIMATAKVIATGTTVVALFSFAAAVHEHQSAQVAEQALTSANASLTEQKAQIASLSRKQIAGSVATTPNGSALTSHSTSSSNDSSTDSNSSGGIAATKAKSSASADPLGSALDLLNSPAMQQQSLVQAKIRLDPYYAALFKQLNLPPEQLSQLKDLIVEKQMAGFDGLTAAHQQGIDVKTDPKGFFIAAASGQQAVDKQISTLLGTAGYSEFQSYEQSLPARNTAQSLQQSLSYTGTPLTDAQTEQLSSVLAKYGNPAIAQNNPFAVMNGDLGIIKINDQGLAQLQGLLSPPQVQTLQDAMQRQNQLYQVRVKMGGK